MTKYELLPAYIAGGRSFAWGECDCCTFAADWLIALGKPDPMADLRGYKTAKEALRLYRNDLLPLVVERLGEPMANPLMAQRGDIALVEFPNGRQACGIVVGEFVAGPSRNGVMFVPLNCAEAAWRV